jgi:hypothetical protein
MKAQFPQSAATSHRDRLKGGARRTLKGYKAHEGTRRYQPKTKSPARPSASRTLDRLLDAATV